VGYVTRLEGTVGPAVAGPYGLIVMVNFWSPLVSSPPFWVPPLSFRWTTMWATPTNPGVKLSVPSGAMLGTTLKNSGPNTKSGSNES